MLLLGSSLLLFFFTRQNRKSIQTDQGEMVREESFLLIKARQKHPKDNLCLCPWKLRSCKSKRWRLWLSVGTSECLKQVQSELLWFRFELLFLYQHTGPTLISRVLTFSGDFFCRLTPKFNQSISISSTSTHQENTNDKNFLRERSKYPSDFFLFSLHQSSLKAGKVLFYYYSHLALRHVCHISLIILNLSSIIIDLSIVFSKHSHSVF